MTESHQAWESYNHNMSHHIPLLSSQVIVFGFIPHSFVILLYNNHIAPISRQAYQQVSECSAAQHFVISACEDQNTECVIRQAFVGWLEACRKWHIIIIINMGDRGLQ